MGGCVLHGLGGGKALLHGICGAILSSTRREMKEASLRRSECEETKNLLGSSLRTFLPPAFILDVATNHPEAEPLCNDIVTEMLQQHAQMNN